MARPVRRLCLLGAFASVVALPGCLTLYSKTEVVRGAESRRPVRFESTEAADKFHTTVKAQSAHVGGSYFGVPFVTFWSKDQVLSESAVWNDAVARCDTDQDGVITLVEAETYSHHPN